MRRFKKIWKAATYWLPLTAVLTFMAVLQKTVCRSVYQRRIWLVAEKPSEARDNGAAFFRWLRKKYPKAECFFVIEKNGVDLKNVEPLGNVVYRNSLRHLWYYLAAENDISSQLAGAYPFEINSRYLRLIKKLKNPKQKCVFLQHGITCRAINVESFFYRSGVHDLLVTASEDERQFIIQYYGYPPEKVSNVGFCRFDSLKMGRCEKVILFMPTWRTWLSSTERQTASAQETAQFENTEFFARYSALLKNPKLLDLLEQYGYKLIFYPHYRLQPFIASFLPCESENVVIAGRTEYDVQQLLLTSRLLVTDYSSVFFDFAYLGKPLIMYQFDYEKYEAAHYQKAYFDYAEDGFGPVLETDSELLEQIEQYIKCNCAPEQKYLDRVDAFFTHRDDHNCERTYEAIQALHDAER